MVAAHARIPMLAGAPAGSVCVGLSLALHAAVIFALGTAHPHWASASWPTAKSLEVTLLAEAAHSETADVAAPSVTIKPEGQTRAAASTPTIVPVKSAAARGDGATQVAVREDPRTVADVVAPRKVAMLPVLAPDVFDPSRYRAMSELSIKPEPIGNIAVPYPEEEARRDVAKLKITLYIDPDGSVAKAEPDRTELPEVFRDAARSAFLRGRFKPGEIDGRAVGARVRVEVAFEQFAPRRRAAEERGLN